MVREEVLRFGGALSKADAAVYLGGGAITERTMDGLVRRRLIGHAKVGRATVFPRAALDAYLAGQTTAPAPNPWGLTDQALRNVREGRAGKPRGQRGRKF
jgi:hypothetical protein